MVRQLAVRIPDALMVKLKVEAAKRRVKVKDLVADAIAAYLKAGKEVE